jgi:methylthioribose-1-phosphate isomerase
MSSFDPKTPDGGAIPIEERSPDEVRRVGSETIAPDVEVWNPAFDVTPADLITAFITDVGVLHPPFADSIPRALGGR